MDAGVTTLSAEAGRPVTVEEMKPIVRKRSQTLDGRLPVTECEIEKSVVGVDHCDDHGWREQRVGTGRRLLRVEVRNSSVPIEKKPEWIKTGFAPGRSSPGCRGW